MLIYLDTAQLAWLESAPDDERSQFVTVWRNLGCELAVSLQVLQEIQKRGTPDLVAARLATLQLLQPLRGIPAGSAGVMMFEITEQIRRRVGGVSGRHIDRGRQHLFPFLAFTTVKEAVAQHAVHLDRWNAIGEVQAELQGNARFLTPLKKGIRVDPAKMTAFLRSVQESVLRGLSRSEAADMFRDLGDRAIEALNAADGNLWEANLKRLGISELSCLSEIRPEDFGKAAGFLEAARDFASDVATDANTDPSTVLRLVNQLRPYDAPGYSIEMAVARARARHSQKPTAGDQVDEEHVCFAPYVDLMFVDKRTKAYVEEEVRRRDGRVAYDPTAKLVRPRNISDVLAAIRRAEITPASMQDS